jgi:hypothetical protein
MTSISATSTNSYPSPLQKLQDQLQAQVNSGAISSTDQNTLSSALTDITSSLQSNSGTDSGSDATSSPGDLKSKIQGLISNEVSSGKLTTDQATELQGVFKAAFGSGAEGTGQAGGVHHGHHGHGTPPPSDGSTATDGTSSGSASNDILQQFLQSVQNSLSTASATPYSATGAASPTGDSSSSLSALLINYQA